MKPASFRYHAPATVADAVGLLAEYGDAAKPLAGGQSLVPMMSLRLAGYEHMIDLNKVAGLAEISRSNGTLRIGATVRQATAEHNAEVAAAVPMLARALPHIGHFQIRNRGTVGGSIAHADPASELPAVTLALDATIEASGPGGARTIAARDFFESTWTTSLADDEILSAVEFPVWSGSCGFAVEEVARRHGDFAIAGCVAGVQLDGDTITRAAVALFGVSSTPVRCDDAEAALLAGGAGVDLVEIGRLISSGLAPTDDVHASSAYRIHLAGVTARRALQRALQEARS